MGTAVSNDQHGFIRVPLVNSRLVLPDLRVTDSSEAMLSGRKPPLRLVMRAVYKDTLLPVPYIRHAISEGFVVAVCSISTRVLQDSTESSSRGGSATTRSRPMTFCFACDWLRCLSWLQLLSQTWHKLCTAKRVCRGACQPVFDSL